MLDTANSPVSRQPKLIKAIKIRPGRRLPLLKRVGGSSYAAKKSGTASPELSSLIRKLFYLLSPTLFMSDSGGLTMTKSKKKIKGAEQIYLFDSTLRDGEQTPGARLNYEEKLEVARQLARLGVDIIEAGFPVSSPGELKAVQAIAEQVKGPTICALARAVQGDIDAAWEAIRNAEKPQF